MEKPGNTLDSAAIPLLTKAPQIVLLLRIDIWVSSTSRKCSVAPLESENFRSSITLEGAILLGLANYCPLRWGESWAPLVFWLNCHWGSAGATIGQSSPARCDPCKENRQRVFKPCLEWAGGGRQF